MKKILFFLFFLPLMAIAQKEKSIFGKFINPDGTIIKGSSVVRFFERQIEITNLVASSANNNTTVQFTMPSDAATASFRNLLNTKEQLRSGEIVITSILYDRRITEYKISMENIAVTECTDINGNIQVVLKATRIGWTYYSTSRGTTTVSSKTGWDAKTGNPWTNF